MGYTNSFSKLHFGTQIIYEIVIVPFRSTQNEKINELQNTCIPHIGTHLH